MESNYLRLHLRFELGSLLRRILGDPETASWGDGIFTGESLQQERESPWAFTLIERVPEAFEIPPSDWPETFSPTSCPWVSEDGYGGDLQRSVNASSEDC